MDDLAVRWPWMLIDLVVYGLIYGLIALVSAVISGDPVLWDSCNRRPPQILEWQRTWWCPSPGTSR